MPADVLLARQREINTVFADSGIDALETVQHQRSGIVATNAALWARYGVDGTWKEKRENLFALIAVEKRQELEKPDAEGKVRKVTEAMVEHAVRTDARYTKLIDDAEQQRTTFYLNNNSIKDLDEKMFRDNAVIRYLTTEPKV